MIQVDTEDEKKMCLAKEGSFRSFKYLDLMFIFLVAFPSSVLDSSDIP